jgi:hypothetical protein
MFLLPSLAALFELPSEGGAAASSRPAGPGAERFCVWLLLTLLIGYRFEVGGDWRNYEHYLISIEGSDLAQVLTSLEPTYGLLNWLSVELNWGIFGVNLVGGAIFALGLVAFCWRQPRPWLALAVAIPYLVIVVGMGYTRQAIALGLAMLGLVALRNSSVFRCVIWLVLAATFHKTAVLLLPVVGLTTTRNRYWTVAWVGLTAIAAYYVLLERDVDRLYANYITADMQSQGALVRLLMNAIPAAVVLIWRPRILFMVPEARAWTLFAILSLVMLTLFFVLHLSTALDRIALYMLPLQIFVFARLPDAFGRQGDGYNAPRAAAFAPGSKVIRSTSSKQTPANVVAILLYYGTVQFVWLNFAEYAVYWVPYRFYPFAS